MDDSSCDERSATLETEPANKDVQQLKLFWDNFLSSSNDASRVSASRMENSGTFTHIESNISVLLCFDIQVEWLELFMFKYEALIDEPGFNVDNEQ